MIPKPLCLAQDELSERVIKVVDKELHKAIVEKEAEMEEIDARILRLQQCLHTLRYCVSLSYYNIDKVLHFGSLYGYCLFAWCHD